MKLLVCLALLMGYLLKRHYSSASAEELRWILSPTSGLTSLLLQREFWFRPGEGYLSQELSILISPACAGVNFLIVAFLTLVLGFGSRFAGQRERLGWLLLALGVGYAVTVLVNALRIVLSVWVARFASGVFGCTFQAAHRLLGVTVYVGALLGLCWGVDVWLRGRRPTVGKRWAPWLALGGYLALTLLLPLLRGAAASPEFLTHAGVVLLVAGGAATLLFAARGRTWDDGRHAIRGSSQHLR